VYLDSIWKEGVQYILFVEKGSQNLYGSDPIRSADRSDWSRFAPNGIRPNPIGQTGQTKRSDSRITQAYLK
jgi:hypothetical protein